ncbi:NIPA-like protein 2 [Exaiptasia diaphana]|uniref:NIPA-like protein 2 n=1 Tax=Exaiptasia diaphana TaxID=2652724 RepID=A0A913X1S6_EXADI|nr:NIPA-like protein 2 [Exaiptasia diaphana]KXJ16072.1 NIPA-like protein 2 [Exaiptasia diaphana]
MASGEDNVSSKSIFIGSALAIGGNLLISISMNIQKYSHIQQSKAEEEVHYLKSKTWWVGLVLMVLGEIGNFSAYGFAPASLVAPLGTTTVIANAIIAVVFLKEKVRYQDAFGVLLAIVGAFLLITFSTKEFAELTGSELAFYMKQWPFLVYLVIEVVIFCVLLYVQMKYNVENVVVFLMLVALLGSLTVISAKAVSSMLNITFGGDSQLGHPLLYVMLIVMVATAVAQVKFLNKAMKSFEATVVVPTNFVLFTISAIISGIVLYREFYGLTFLEIFMFLFGCVLSFVGVYFITSNRKVENSEEQLLLTNADLFPGFLSLSSSKLIAVQPGNALSSNSAEYPMLMAKSNQDPALNDESEPIVTDR